MLRPTKHPIPNDDMKVLSLKDCLGKTACSADGKISKVSVATHCKTVGMVARELKKRLPDWLKKIYFPDGSELISASHDVGKICPSFQEKIYRDLGQRLGIGDPLIDAAIGYHFTVSQAALAPFKLKFIPEILGRHHGQVPSSVNSPDAQIYGGALWQERRIELLNLLRNELVVDWPEIKSPLMADLISGLTVISDWIGSGPELSCGDSTPSADQISKAVDRAGFILPRIKKGLSFRDVFPQFSPNQVQDVFSQLVRKEGVYVLEAPMGVGKTEAALYAAYKILEQNKAKGLYFALPTRLTSDKIYERVKHFLHAILDEVEGDHASSLLLLHGMARLKKIEMGEEGAPGHLWFNSLRMGLLAPFSVGTIDQALLAVMNIKYHFVRAFGLAGKVVILDEVHSYDGYTGVILNELISVLRKLHCTVIILSATLTKKQRYSLLEIEEKSWPEGFDSKAYPLISFRVDDSLKEHSTPVLEKATVIVELVHDDNAIVDEVLSRAENGEQILWIENSVIDAQSWFERMVARSSGLNTDCGLIHSRYTQADRIRNEEGWVNAFGLPGVSLRNQKGRILIGTQVLEQSLDIDADFMVTRLCPTDMLFQRMGRLWRHRKLDGVRPAGAARKLCVLAPSVQESLSDTKAFGRSSSVYDPYVLCRSLEVWASCMNINLPDDIRTLLEKTYEDRHENGLMRRYKLEMTEEREKLRRFALSHLTSLSKTLSESQVHTRYREEPSVDVLLLKKISFQHQNVLLRFLDDSCLKIPKKTNAAHRREIAADVARNTVSVPQYLAPTIDSAPMEWLKDVVYLGNGRDECLFRMAIVRDSDRLAGINNGEASEKYELSYNTRLGYRARRKGE